MKVLTVVISEAGHRRLKAAAEELDRSIGDLAEAAIEEEAVRWENAQARLRSARAMVDAGIASLRDPPRPVRLDWLGGGR